MSPAAPVFQNGERNTTLVWLDPRLRA